jgi:hypothetical protein
MAKSESLAQKQFVAVRLAPYQTAFCILNSAFFGKRKSLSLLPLLKNAELRMQNVGGE